MHREPDPPEGPHEEAAGPPGENDRELVRKAALGDEAAFETLVRRKRERVYWIAYRIIGSKDDALEIAQATFVRLWRSLDKFDPAQNFDTWLYRVTVNLAIDHYRSRSSARATVSLDDHEGDSPGEPHPDPGAENPFAAVAGSELSRIFETLAARLGEKQRAVFVLSQIEGIPTEEIAQIMGITPSTVRNHLFQARRALQEGIRKHYPEYDPSRRRGPGTPGRS